MALDSKMFILDIANGVRATATSHAITATEAKNYVGFAVDVDTTVSFNGGSEAFPIKAGVPMALPANTTSIDLGVTAKLYLGN